MTEQINIKDEIEPYEELKEDVFSEISFKILEYTREQCPNILNNRWSGHDITELFCKYLNFPNPFIIIENDNDNDDEEEEEYD